MTCTSSRSEWAAGWTVIVEPQRGPIVEGGAARRGNLLRCLTEGGAEVITLPGRATTRLRRLIALPAESLAFARALARARGPDVLVGYPDLPVLTPRSMPRLVAAAVALVVGRLAFAFRGRRLVVDVADWPRPQALTLNLRIGVPAAALRAFEWMLMRIAREALVPSRGLAHHVASDVGLPDRGYRLLVNGAPVPPAPAPMAAPVTAAVAVSTCPRQDEVADPPANGVVRFIYAGDLSLTQERGVRALVESFRTQAPGDVELVLAGSGGTWIDALGPIVGLRHLGEVPEPQLMSWVRSSHVGVIPYPPAGYYRLVYPTKLALYVVCGLAVVSTPLPEIESLIRDHGLGVIVEAAELPTIFGRRGLMQSALDSRRGASAPDLTWDHLTEQALGARSSRVFSPNAMNSGMKVEAPPPHLCQGAPPPGPGSSC